MYRYVVITDWETAAGFALGGVEVFEAADSEEAGRKLGALLKEPGVGLIGLNERFLDGLDEGLRKHVETSALPVVVPFPDFRERGLERGDAYLSSLIQQAIGYRIKLRA